ncbi:MAG: CoA transferase [Chloroflexi bacterium]|nr:CoA transferase [Chloroflexota bacterium]
MGPLDGIRVLDFTRWQQGPWATVMLGDMGAEIIKLEERNHGDLGRALGRQPDGFCAYFEAHDRNKKSITVDVRKPEGKEIVYKLVERVDVVAHNFRPGVMDRLGIGYDTLKAINPRLIYGSASGFGAEGPLAGRPSYDVIGQAMGGIMVSQAGGPGGEPRMALPGVADQTGAIYFAFGIAMALIARERFGIGQQVDASLYGSQIALQAMNITAALRTGAHPPSRPKGSPTFRPYGCADGKWLAVGVLDPAVYPRLCYAVERPDLVADERFAEPFARWTNADALEEELGQAFGLKDRGYWLDRLTAHDVPSSPVQDYTEVASCPQALINGYITTIEHPSLGELRVVGPPVRLTETPAEIRMPAPELGQHTEEVLLELGYDWAQIEELKTAEVV